MSKSILNTIKPCFSIFCRKRLYLNSSRITENTNKKVNPDITPAYHHILFSKIYLQVITSGYNVIFLKKLLNDLTFPLSHLDSVDCLFSLTIMKNS